MNKHDYIFRCPYRDECLEDEPKFYFENEPIGRSVKDVCEHPFLTHNGEPLCSIILTEEIENADYDLSLMQIRVNHKIRALWFFDSIKKLLKGDEE